VGLCATWWPPSENVQNDEERKFRNSVPCIIPRKVWLTPLLECRAVTSPYRKTQKLDAKWIFAPDRIPLVDKSLSVPAQETAKHRAKCGWPPVNDVCAVTLPRRETSWNLQGCPKLTNTSQPFVGRSSPYYGDMWRRYRCLISFFPIFDTCLSSEDIAGQICAMVPKWRFFCVLYFQRAACRTFQTCILNSH